jgi:transposase
MYIKCARTGKSFPDSNAAKACEDKYCHAGLPCPFERTEENIESDEPVVPEVFQKVIDETTSRNKERGGFCAVIFGVTLISLGVSLFL